MKTFEQDFKTNPSFNTVTGLSNTTYDNSNIRSGQMATEDQIKQLWVDGTNLQNRINECCRDIVMWKSYVRVVAENTGIVVSDWLDNVAVGSTRRGLPFTMEFSLPHDSNKFLDNRSNYVNPNPPTNNNDGNFHVVVNSPGKATNLNNEFDTKAIGNYQDNYYLDGGFSYAGNWRGITLNNFINIISIEFQRNGEIQKPLPVMSSDKISGYYYVYKDTNNKIKIDIKRRDQFAEGEYLALFFTQFVLRSGATL